MTEAVQAAPRTRMGQPTVDTLLDQLEKVSGHYRELDTQLKVADGDRDAALKSWVESTDDEQAVQLRKQIQAAQQALLSLAETRVPETTLSDEDRESLVTERAEAKKQISDGRQAILKIAKLVGADENEVKEVLSNIPDPSRGSGGGHGARGGAGTGVPRPSVRVFVSGGGQEGEHAFESFSLAAGRYKLSTADFNTAYAEAAGVEFSETASIDTPQEFTVKSGDVTYNVRTEPKPRGKKAVESAAPAVVSEDTEENAA